MSQAALADFFFTAPPAVVQLQMVEIYHPDFSQTHRLCRNSGKDIYVLHESGVGPFVYSYVPMLIKNLGTTSSLDQQMEFTLGDVGEILPAELELIAEANGFQTKPTITYREYRSDLTGTLAVDTEWIFDGIDDAISVGNQYAFERTDEWSVTSWGHTNAVAGHIISKQAASGQRGWKLATTGAGELFFILSHAPTALADRLEANTVGATIVDGQEHFMAVSYSGSSLASGIKFYVDGVAHTSVSVGVDDLNDTIVTTDPFLIGLRGDGGGWEGGLRHVAIWDRVLTAAEMSEVYNDGDPPDLSTVSCASALIGWWIIGPADAVGANGIIDRSSSGFHGTADGGLVPVGDAEETTFLEPIYGPFELEVNAIAFNRTGCVFTAKPPAFNRGRIGEVYDPERFPPLKAFV
jgi:hypothetical protein